MILHFISKKSFTVFGISMFLLVFATTVLAQTTTTNRATTTAQVTTSPTAIVGVTQNGSLNIGATGSSVITIQQKLKTLGYYSGPISGTYDQSTASAVLSFQQANALKADGIAGARTVSAISASTVPVTPVQVSSSPLLVAPVVKPRPSTISPVSGVATPIAPVSGVQPVVSSSTTVQTSLPITQTLSLAPGTCPDSTPSIRMLSPNGGTIQNANKVSVKWEYCNLPSDTLVRASIVNPVANGPWNTSVWTFEDVPFVAGSGVMTTDIYLPPMPTRLDYKAQVVAYGRLGTQVSLIDKSDQDIFINVSGMGPASCVDLERIKGPNLTGDEAAVQNNSCVDLKIGTVTALMSAQIGSKPTNQLKLNLRRQGGPLLTYVAPVLYPTTGYDFARANFTSITNQNSPIIVGKNGGAVRLEIDTANMSNNPDTYRYWLTMGLPRQLAGWATIQYVNVFEKETDRFLKKLVYIQSNNSGVSSFNFVDHFEIKKDSFNITPQ